MLIKHFACCVPFACLLMSPLALAATELKPVERDYFEKQVRPLLVAKCYKCHSAKTKQQGELVLDTKAGWEVGGENGPAVVPGKPTESLLIDAIQFGDFEMPPTKKLAEDEIAILVRWVQMGAPDPRVGGGPKAPPGIDIAAGRSYWAFQAPKKADPPEVKDTAWPRSNIDRFLRAAQEARGVTPVADANRLALIRRLTFDLTGLPPTKEEVEAFVDDGESSDVALEHVVDRMLDSPRFGERWGRHWLDVARYADSRGNALFRYAWQYRDYVIASLNDDLPFDQFIKEQLAGDLLPADTDQERDRLIIATGFLALGDRNDGQSDEVVDEQLDCTTKAFMALTVTCARCHDHKFDPIPTEDYYAMAGIFRSTELQRSGQKNKTPRMLSGADSKKHLEYEKKLDAFRKNVVRKVETAKRDRDRRATTLRNAERRYVGKPSDKPRPDVQRAKTQLAQSEKKLAQVMKEFDAQTAELEKLQQRVACAVGEAKKIADQKLYIRGERSSQGDVIPRGFVQVVSAEGAHLLEDKKQSGRLELAEWIASPDNPLTARTFVNRVWHHLFGAGIVPTADNFGALGQRPTNQPLLDYLAVEFMEDGWSVKRLVRRIVLSRAYQLSVDADPKNEELDGDNQLLWRMNRRRLEAEAIRDAILAFSGHLDLDPPAVGQLAEFAYQRPNFDSPNRSVYLPILRQGGYDFLATFDGADPTIVVGSRDVSVAPAQALYLLNSPLVMNESKRAAERLLAEKDCDDAQRIDLAYWAALSRAPTDQEIAWLLEFLKAYPEVSKKDGKDATLEAWTRACQTLIASAEFQLLN